MTPEDLFNKLKDKIEQEGLRFSSLDELNAFGKQIMEEQNNSPNPDFEGLSPFQMQKILYSPFSKGCIVQFKERRANQEIHSPMTEMCKIILERIDPEKGLKLTQKGNLPRQLVKDVHYSCINPEKEYHRLTMNINKEMDSATASMAHALIKISNLVKNQQNKLFLTEKGKKALGDDFLLLKHLFTAFVNKYNKGYLDGYESEEIGHVGILFVLYLIKKYGEQEREAVFYANKYFQAFPMLVEQGETKPYYLSPYRQAENCFITRVINRGFSLFGFISKRHERRADYMTSYFIKKAPLLENFFYFKPVKLSG